MNINCDVLVAGGGAAGIAAAYSSARAGARTVLLEMNATVGGIATSGIVNCIAGIFLDKKYSFLNNGFMPYFAKQLSKNNISENIFSNNRYGVLLYEPSAFLKTTKHLIKKLEYFNNSNILQTTTKGKAIVGIEVKSNGKAVFIYPKYVIDCTGDGELSFIAGAKALKNRSKLQSGGFGFTLNNVCTQNFFESGYLPVIRKFAKSHSLNSIADNIAFLRSYKTSELHIKFSTNSNNLAEAINTAYCIHESLRTNFSSFKNSSISNICQKIYNREGRRIEGDYVLNEADLINCAKHSDAAARNNWPIELWYGTKAPSFTYLPKNDYYTIPFRSLLVKGFTNLMVAGRCISVSQRALGSTRVIGACLSLGEFCGLAAALASRKDINLRETDIGEIDYIRNNYESL